MIFYEKIIQSNLRRACDEMSIPAKIQYKLSLKSQDNIEFFNKKNDSCELKYVGFLSEDWSKWRFCISVDRMKASPTPADHHIACTNSNDDERHDFLTCSIHYLSPKRQIRQPSSILGVSQI